MRNHETLIVTKRTLVNALAIWRQSGISSPYLPALRWKRRRSWLEVGVEITMSDDRPSNVGKMMQLLDLELSERELYFIGRIVAAWGALESEIFTQTLQALNPNSLDDLPPDMKNNLQPSCVRKHWKEQVVDKASGKRREVLLEQHEKIEALSEDRHAIVHGMWEYSKSEPEKITVWRVRKGDLEKKVFTADDLMNISLAVDQINYYLRFPLDNPFGNSGSFMSRRMRATLTGHPVSKELWHGIAPKD